MDENPQSQDQTSSAQPPTQQTSSNDNLPPKKSKTGSIVGIVVGVIALAGIVVSIVFVMAPLSSPSQADYRATYDYISEMRFAKNGLSTYPSDKSEAKKAKEVTDKFKKDLDELGKMKAVTEDKEIKESYDKFAAKLDKFINSHTIMLEAAEIKEASSMRNYSYSFGDGEAYLEATKKIEAIAGNIKNERNKKFVKDIIKSNKDVATAAFQMKEANRNGDYSYEAEYGFYRQKEKNENITSAWVKDVYEIIDSEGLLKEFDRLSRLIAEKLAERM